MTPAKAKVYEAVLAHVRAQPGCSSTQVADAVLGSAEHTACRRVRTILVDHMATGAVERRGNRSTSTYWPSGRSA